VIDILPILLVLTNVVGVCALDTNTPLTYNAYVIVEAALTFKSLVPLNKKNLLPLQVYVIFQLPSYSNQSLHSSQSVQVQPIL